MSSLISRHAEAENQGEPKPATREALQDPHSFYEFKGETYVHGMMDGEALRAKFYDEKPDIVFELR